MYSKFVYLDRLCHSFSSVWMKNYPVSLSSSQISLLYIVVFSCLQKKLRDVFFLSFLFVSVLKTCDQHDCLCPYIFVSRNFIDHDE